MYNVGDIKDEVLVRLGVSSTSGYYSDAILNDWLKQSYSWAAGLHKWPQTEGRITTTYVSTIEEWNFENLKADSIRLLQVGGKRFNKTDFGRYQAYREDETGGTKKIFSDFGGLVFLNPNSGVSGSLVVWGQYTPAELDTSDNTTTTVFDAEFNLAIAEKMISQAYQREREEDRAQLHLTRALEILEGMWKRVTDEQFGYLAAPNDVGMFTRVNILDGEKYGDLIRRDQFY